MAYRPKGYGLTSEVNRKIASKYSVDLEIDARLWIEEVIQENISNEETAAMEPGMERFHKELKDGVVLCKLMNCINPSSVLKINSTKLAFKQMENIGKFLDACSSLGMLSADLFQTADLYERVNMSQVVNTIYALGRKAQKIGYAGAVLGVKESDSNPRQFTPQQLNAGQAVIGLQMGSNQGATQKGDASGVDYSGYSEIQRRSLAIEHGVAE